MIDEEFKKAIYFEMNKTQLVEYILELQEGKVSPLASIGASMEIWNAINHLKDKLEKLEETFNRKQQCVEAKLYGHSCKLEYIDDVLHTEEDRNT